MTREELRGRTVIWPVYIDANASRSQGRKVPLSLAVESPSAEEIARAAQALGLNPVIEEAPYPRAWLTVRKRVVVDKKFGRMGTLRAVAAKVLEARSRGGRKEGAQAKQA